MASSTLTPDSMADKVISVTPLSDKRVPCRIISSLAPGAPEPPQEAKYVEIKVVAVAGGEQVTLELYKNKKSSRKTRKNKDSETIRLTDDSLCAVLTGTRQSQTRSEVRATLYLAVVLIEKTLFLETPTDSESHKLLNLWRDLIITSIPRLGDYQGCNWPVTVKKVEGVKSTLHRQAALLCRSRGAVTLCDKTRMTCVHTYQVSDIGRVESKQDGKMLKISFNVNRALQTYSLETTRAGEICEKLSGSTRPLSVQPPPVSPPVPGVPTPARPLSAHPNNEDGYLHLPVFNDAPASVQPQVDEYTYPVDRYTYPSDPATLHPYDDAKSVWDGVYDDTVGGVYDLDINKVATDIVTDVLRSPYVNCRSLQGAPTGPSGQRLYLELLPAMDEYLTTNIAASMRRPQNPETGRSAEVDIYSTIHNVLSNHPPRPDTLELSPTVRRRLCLKLYVDTRVTASWEALAEAVGLNMDAVLMIKAIIIHHHVPQTAAEIVLRHWQFVHNAYGDRDPSRCPRPCSWRNLVDILKRVLKRQDLVDLVLAGEAT